MRNRGCRRHDFGDGKYHVGIKRSRDMVVMIDHQCMVFAIYTLVFHCLESH